MIAAKPAGVQLSPGRFARTSLPVPVLPTHLLCEVVPTGGGEFRLRPLPHEWVRLTTPVLKNLGLLRHRRALQRLGAAGFIAIRKPTPFSYEVNLPSLAAHLAAVEADLDFWDNPERRARWREAIGYGRGGE